MSDNSDLVSVVVPTYNRAHYLPQCLDSILGQTHRNLEVLVVDDGSTDGTRSLMQEYCSRDNRIKYILQPNGGVSAARNTGLREAQGDFIALLDSDDAWLPWKLTAQLAAFAKLPAEVGMIWTDMAAIGPSGEMLHNRYLRKMYGAYQALGARTLFANSTQVEIPELPAHDRRTAVLHGNIYSQMLFGNLVHTSTTLLRRERADAVGLFDEKLRCGEDYIYHLTTCRLGPVGYLDASSILYRIGCDDQITVPRNQLPFSRAFLNTVEHEFREHADLITLTPQDKSRILSHAHMWLGSASRLAGQRGSAISHCLQALMCQPGKPATWMELARNFMPTKFRRFIRTRILGQQPRPGEATQASASSAALPA